MGISSKNSGDFSSQNTSPKCFHWIGHQNNEKELVVPAEETQDDTGDEEEGEQEVNT